MLLSRSMGKTVSTIVITDDDADTLEACIKAFPPLRVGNADVAIVFSGRPEDRWLVPSAELMKLWFFPAHLSGRWFSVSTGTSNPINSMDDSSRHEDSLCKQSERFMPLKSWIHTYALEHRPWKDLLESRLSNSIPLESSPLSSTDDNLSDEDGYHRCRKRRDCWVNLWFHESHLSVLGNLGRIRYSPPKRPYRCTEQSDRRRAEQSLIRNASVLAHKVIFSLFLGEPVDLSLCSRSAVLLCVAESIAYAHFYGMLEHIRAPLRDLYVQLAGDEEIRWRYPGYTYEVALMLRIDQHFRQAFKHILVLGNAQYIIPLGLLTGKAYNCHRGLPDADELIELRGALLLHAGQQEISDLATSVTINLRELGLGSNKDEKSPSSRVAAAPTWQNIRYQEPFLPGNSTKTFQEKISYIAQSTFADFLTRSFGGIETYGRSKDDVQYISLPPPKISHFFKTIGRILHYATTQDTSCFGVDAIPKLAKIFAPILQPGHKKARPALREALLSLLNGAKAVIEENFESFFPDWPFDDRWVDSRSEEICPEWLPVGSVRIPRLRIRDEDLPWAPFEDAEEEEDSDDDSSEEEEDHSDGDDYDYDNYDYHDHNDEHDENDESDGDEHGGKNGNNGHDWNYGNDWDDEHDE